MQGYRLFFNIQNFLIYFLLYIYYVMFFNDSQPEQIILE